MLTFTVTDNQPASYDHVISI